MQLLNALAQSEKRQHGEDNDHQANNVDDAVHLSFLYAGLKTDLIIQDGKLSANSQVTLCRPWVLCAITHKQADCLSCYVACNALMPPRPSFQ
jgi:hypothetical protein